MNEPIEINGRKFELVETGWQSGTYALKPIEDTEQGYIKNGKFYAHPPIKEAKNGYTLNWVKTTTLLHAASGQTLFVEMLTPTQAEALEKAIEATVEYITGDNVIDLGGKQVREMVKARDSYHE